MFFPQRVVNVDPSEKVLEVGPGAQPHPRSNTLLEKMFQTAEEAEAQRGYTPPLSKTDKDVVYYSGGKFPFKDKEFDYVICSHVLEHVEIDELPRFISELERVARKGYIEFPNIFYEMINYEPVHIWLMNHRDDTIFFLDKNKVDGGFIHKCYREMFKCSDGYMWGGIDRYKEFFFVGFEWENKIRYRIIDTLNELISEQDYKTVKNYFDSYALPPSGKLGAMVAFKNRVSRFLKKNFCKKYSIHSTAQIEDKKFIFIGEGSEIKDYVIVRAYEKPVVVGKFTQINPYTVIYGYNSVLIGDNVMIAPHCMIASGNHDFKQTKVPMRFAGNLSRGPIVIEDNVWIGANVTITDGVRIGKDAVVAANSVVSADVEPYSIVGGVPAKKLGSRLGQ